MEAYGLVLTKNMCTSVGPIEEFSKPLQAGAEE